MTAANRSDQPQWPVRRCVFNHPSNGIHYHVTYDPDRSRGRFDPENSILFNSRVHEDSQYHTEQGVRYTKQESLLTQPEPKPEPEPEWLDIRRGHGPDQIRTDMAGRVEVEFFARRRSDDPLRLNVGCQEFAPALALNNGGSVSSTEDVDRFLVRMVGTLNTDGRFVVKTRSGRDRTVTTTELNAYVERARSLAPSIEEINLLTGVFQCATPGHSHGIFVASSSIEDASRMVVVRLRGHLGYDTGDAGFASWPECRPSRIGSFSQMFGSTMGRDRRRRVKVAPGQFPGAARVS